MASTLPNLNSNLSFSDLAHGESFCHFLTQSLSRLLQSNIPLQSGLPWVVGDYRQHRGTEENPRSYWIKGSGGLSPYVSGLSDLVRDVSDDFGRKMEHKFLLKLQPRNIYLNWVFEQKCSNIPWNVPLPRYELSQRDFLDTMERDGLGKTKFVPPLSHIYAPPGLTSMGLIWDDQYDCIMHGAKGKYWMNVLRKSAEILAWSNDAGFNWRNIDARYKEVIMKWDAIFIPSVRLDRGAFKIRLLFAGVATFYALEAMVSVGIKRDMKNSMNFGYKPERGSQFVEVCRGQHVITGDLEASDLHMSQPMLKNAWIAWQQMYDLPESLMCVLYAYNTYGPIAMWDTTTEPRLTLQNKCGINPSGSGAFVIILNLIMRCMISKAKSNLMQQPISKLAYQDAGLSFGDDHVVTISEGSLAKWIAEIEDFGHRCPDSSVAIGKFKFLRMLYGPEYERVPILCSRFRNAACPEDPGILYRTPELTAVALRAQMLPFVYMKQTSSRWRNVYDYLSKIFCPDGTDYLLSSWSESDLSRNLEGGERELDALFFAKRYYQVKEDT